MLLLAKSISQHNNREQNVPECELILLFSSYFSSKLVVFLLYNSLQLTFLKLSNLKIFTCCMLAKGGYPLKTFYLNAILCCTELFKNLNRKS